MSHMNRVPAEERVVVPDNCTSCFVACCSLQDDVSGINDAIRKFTSPGPIVINSFGGILSTARVCMLITRKFRFSGTKLTLSVSKNH